MGTILLPVALLILPLAILWRYRRAFISKENNFNGPPGYPIIGNLLDVPVHQPFVRFAEWQETYGDIVSLKIFGRRLYVLNSKAAAVDLFEKRSAIYSERPVRNMANLCGFGRALLLQSYGDVARKTRKLMHAEIGRSSAHKHIYTQEREVQSFVQRVYLAPENLLADSQRLASSIILTISYGYQVTVPDDPLVTLAEEVMGYLGKVVTPNNYLVDSLPFLRYLPEWIPGAGFQVDAKRCRRLIDRLVGDPYNMVREQLDKGVDVYPSLVSRNLEGSHLRLTNEDHDIIKWTAGGLYAGGSHSTVAIIMSFFLVMVVYPDVQKKAQEEIDRVLCEGRLPALTDRPSLPYIDCILQEILRWRPVAPIAAHSSLVDDVYQGVRIPAGSVVMANTWAMTHNKEIYHHPDDFLPDRFLSSDAPDPRPVVFGLGRRVCPGEYLVDNLLWMVMATTLATLDILPEMGRDGKLIIPSTEYTSGLVIQPLPFHCRIFPRSPSSVDLISEANTRWT